MPKPSRTSQQQRPRAEVGEGVGAAASKNPRSKSQAANRPQWSKSQATNRPRRSRSQAANRRQRSKSQAQWNRSRTTTKPQSLRSQSWKKRHPSRPRKTAHTQPSGRRRPGLCDTPVNYCCFADLNLLRMFAGTGAKGGWHTHPGNVSRTDQKLYHSAEPCREPPL